VLKRITRSERKAAENLAEAARRGDPEALRFITEFMDQRRRDTVSQN
jgi:hypothetical protein